MRVELNGLLPVTQYEIYVSGVDEAGAATTAATALGSVTTMSPTYSTNELEGWCRTVSDDERAGMVTEFETWLDADTRADDEKEAKVTLNPKP